MLNDLFSRFRLQTRELDPFSSESRAHFDHFAEIESIIFGPAEHGEQELRHAHLIAAAILEDSDYNEETEQIDHAKDHWSPIVTMICHSNDYSKDEKNETSNCQTNFYISIPDCKLTTIIPD